MAQNTINSKATKEQKEQVATSTSVNTTAKATPKTKANPKKETKASNFSAIMNSVKDLTPSTSVSIRGSVYKTELFQDADDKQKKAIRRKLRRIRDSFIGEYLECQKDKAKLQGLQERWVKYASQVYNDVNHIFETNTIEDNRTLCDKFLKAMAQDYTK